MPIGLALIDVRDDIVSIGLALIWASLRLTLIAHEIVPIGLALIDVCDDIVPISLALIVYKRSGLDIGSTKDVMQGY